MNTKQKIEMLYDALFERYYPPSNNIFSNWHHISTDRMGNIKTKEKISELLQAGYLVKCGYNGSAIRGIHNRYIFYK